MHELSITRSVVAIVAERTGDRRVTQVRLRIGRLSGVEVSAVEFCFEACAAGTALEGARLVIERVEGRGECPACGASAPMKALVCVCSCEARPPLRIVSGEELLVVDVELEDG